MQQGMRQLEHRREWMDVKHTDALPNMPQLGMAFERIFLVGLREPSTHWFPPDGFVNLAYQHFYVFQVFMYVLKLFHDVSWSLCRTQKILSILC